MKNQKGFIVPFLIVVAIVAIGSGIYLYAQNKKTDTIALQEGSTNQPANNLQTKNNINNQSITTQTTNDNLNWKIFSNNYFSINYPSDWANQDLNNEITHRDMIGFKAPNSTSFTWTVDVYKKPYTTKDTLLKKLDQVFGSYAKTTSISFNNINATETIVNFQGGTGIHIVFDDNVNTYDTIRMA